MHENNWRSLECVQNWKPGEGWTGIQANRACNSRSPALPSGVAAKPNLTVGAIMGPCGARGFSLNC